MSQLSAQQRVLLEKIVEALQNETELSKQCKLLQQHIQQEQTRKQDVTILTKRIVDIFQVKYWNGKFISFQRNI